jgi:hypothetical protein
MEKIEVRTQPSQPAPEQLSSVVVDPAKCPTCLSGVDPSLGGNLFQEALREGL